MSNRSSGADRDGQPFIKKAVLDYHPEPSEDLGHKFVLQLKSLYKLQTV